MSSSVDQAQVQWLEQLAAMRKAIAELNLPANTKTSLAYGDNLEYDDDLSAPESSDDIWDIGENEYEDQCSSEPPDQFLSEQDESTRYDQQWLAIKCERIARNTSGLEAGALQDQITTILAGDKTSE